MVCQHEREQRFEADALETFICVFQVLVLVVAGRVNSLVQNDGLLASEHAPTRA
jgi:uncharacterized protein involved in response to NO